MRPLAILLCAGACATQPDVNQPPTNFDGGGPAYADTLIGFESGGSPTTCTAEIPACGPDPVTGSCPPNAALGAPDMMAYALPANGTLEVAFRCSVVMETGSPDGNPSPDFKIWSTVPSGAHAVVEVSYDGTDYRSLDTLGSSDQSFDLSRIDLPVIRFVRLAADSAGGIELDAFEAL